MPDYQFNRLYNLKNHLIIIFDFRKRYYPISFRKFRGFFIFFIQTFAY